MAILLNTCRLALPSDPWARKPRQFTMVLNPLAFAYQRTSRWMGPRFRSLVHCLVLEDGQLGTSGRFSKRLFR
ncbi:hypothetical protein PEC301877_05280 [Pectobacterium carotovorum subsp. carotovorum]|nr:hypothetical protein PEC301877_05280 [Pectobacterium carotovorum subsp. carotovorum]